MNPSTTVKVEEKFSPWKFLIVIVTTFGIVEGIIKIVLHWLGFDWLWEVQLTPALGKAITIFLGQQVVNNFVEWFFHRYMLHSPLVPGFSRLFVQHHVVHHMLTLVRPVEEKWRNNYPIDHERKYRASYFPFYTYAAFSVAALGSICCVQALLPTWPVLFYAIASIGWSLMAYEFIHAAEHLPAGFWHWVFKLWFVGDFMQRLYGFHEFHHEWTSRFKVNMNISGFVCGIPLADWVFGTLRFPKKSFAQGTTVDWTDVDVPLPRFWWIRRLDKIADEKVLLFKS